MADGETEPLITPAQPTPAPATPRTPAPATPRSPAPADSAATAATSAGLPGHPSTYSASFIMLPSPVGSVNPAPAGPGALPPGAMAMVAVPYGIQPGPGLMPQGGGAAGGPPAGMLPFMPASAGANYGGGGYGAAGPPSLQNRAYWDTPTVAQLEREYRRARTWMSGIGWLEAFLWFPIGVPVFVDLCYSPIGRGRRHRIGAWFGLALAFITQVVLLLFGFRFVALLFVFHISAAVRPLRPVAGGICGVLTCGAGRGCGGAAGRAQAAAIGKANELEALEKALRMVDDAKFHAQYDEQLRPRDGAGWGACL